MCWGAVKSDLIHIILSMTVPGSQFQPIDYLDTILGGNRDRKSHLGSSDRGRLLIQTKASNISFKKHLTIRDVLTNVSAKNLKIHPRIFVSPQILFFCELKPHAKFPNPTITPSGRKVTRRRERERKNNAFNSGHFVSVTVHATTRTNKSVLKFATSVDKYEDNKIYYVEVACVEDNKDTVCGGCYDNVSSEIVDEAIHMHEDVHCARPRGGGTS